MFSIDDVVHYGSYGACRIIDIADREFCGVTGRYYVLEPVFDDRCTYYVDVNNELAAARLRPALGAEQAERLVAQLPDAEEQWLDNPKQRRSLYGEIISRGDRLELVGLIKALRLHERRQRDCGKKLNMSDEQSLRLAEKMIGQELALSLGLSPEEAVARVAERLEQTAG